jgi:hypothetical protein
MTVIVAGQTSRLARYIVVMIVAVVVCQRRQRQSRLLLMNVHLRSENYKRTLLQVGVVGLVLVVMDQRRMVKALLFLLLLLVVQTHQVMGHVTHVIS